MRRLALLAALAVAAPTLAQDASPEPEETVEAEIEGDLNGDGLADLATVTRREFERTLTVRLSYKSEVDFGLDAGEALPLEDTLLGPASLEIVRGVLKVDDLVGGTTAVASTRRYRYDAPTKRMRLIGLDATLYSRTYAHDGFEFSWNLLNGDLVTRELHLNEKGGDAAYDPIVERKSKRRAGTILLADTPDPETLIAELSGV